MSLLNAVIVDILEMYSARLYSNSETPDGPCSRAVFCMVPYQPLYSKVLECQIHTVGTVCPGARTDPATMVSL